MRIKEMKENEEIIDEVFENVGFYEGFNHRDVKRILRRALRLKDERRKKK